MSDVEEDILVSQNGNDYGGWKEVSVTRSIESIANTFNLALTEKWAGQVQRRPMSGGDACTVKIGDDTVITGFLDEHDPAIDDQSHEVRASGRDATGDLVDCSAVNSPGEWRGRNALQLVSVLCAPFGISVTAKADLGKGFASFKLQEGETVFQAIDRICKARALLPVSDGLGGLVLMRSGTSAPRVDAPLVLGGNIKRIGTRFSMIERFSQITVKGQQTQSDGLTPDQAAGPSATAKDPSVKRYRPLVIVADDEGDGVTLNDRALWEVSVRAGRARSADVTVWGWRNRTGALWLPNTIVPVHAAELDVDGEMLITTVCHTQNDQGRLTMLRLSPPQAFDLIALEEKETTSGDAGDALTGTPKYVGAELVKESQ